jgi:hypothetical protein
MIVEYLKWEDLKSRIAKEKDDPYWVYRGHASSEWKMESTLYRFLEDKKIEIRANYYHERNTADCIRRKSLLFTG